MDIEKEAKWQAKEEARFAELLRGVHDNPWWRRFLQEVSNRRLRFSETLELGVEDQRTEDRIRGQISELKWIIALDAYAAMQKEATNGPER